MDNSSKPVDDPPALDIEALVSDLKHVSQIADPIERQLAIIALSKKKGFSTEDYQSLLAAYDEQKKSKWTQWKIAKPLIRIEGVFEEINYWLERWDFLKFLDYASKVTIIIGLVTFLTQLSKLEERANLERRQLLYEAWQVVTSATDQSGSGGRIEALQTLVRNGVSLSGVNLENAYLVGVDLEGADLQGANLQGADLSDANVSRANLANADLRRANLNETIFHKANLRGSQLDQAKNIITAYLENAFYDETTTGKVANSGAILLQSLSGIDLRNERRLDAAPLENLDFSQANLAGVSLREANLSSSNFEDANLKEANLENANISSD